MQVVKRNGASEDVQFDKILFRVKAVSKDLKVEPVNVAKTVINGLYDKITSSEIDTLLAETAAVMTTEHPDYSKLASRIAVSNLQKNTKNFYQTMKDLGKAGILSAEFIKVLKSHGKDIEKHLKNDRDSDFTYFAFKTLERSYLLKLHGKTVERPCFLWMRVAIAIGGDDLNEVLELYELLSTGKYTHATPTLFNAGCTRPQYASCFLLSMESDSLEGIYKSLWECAEISKHAGGIGIHIHNVRAKGSFIKGTGGYSDGIVPMLRVFNETARYVNQSGKRKGSIAVYLEPWHADIEDFLMLKRNTGKEEMRCRDLFLALWIPDLFMERVKNDGVWSLMCPNDCPGLPDAVGADFVALYCKYEEEGKYRRQIKARDLMLLIIESQIETGVPYILYKDACNLKSNQKNLGTIKSSNLCTEIVEFSDDKETAVCNLASVCLPKFVKEDGTFDFEELHRVVKIMTKNLNKVIDKTYYPNKKTQTSNLAHRPIGIGVQGLADVFFLMDIAFDSPEAAALNKAIFETMYHAALEASCQLAQVDGAYKSFPGSPASQGILQFHMWNVTPSSRYDWTTLIADIIQYGLRNSLLMAPMPTASTAQLFDNNEAAEAQTSNIGKREVMSGEFIVMNKHLILKLEHVGLWNADVRDKIIAGGGSVQHIEEIPEKIKQVYKTVWEISQKVIIDMAIDRGAFICQSQSMNVFLASPTVAQVSSLHMYAWSRGAKTGMYYLRSKPAMQATKVNTKSVNMSGQEQISCSLDKPEDCVACSA